MLDNKVLFIQPTLCTYYVYIVYAMCKTDQLCISNKSVIRGKGVFGVCKEMLYRLWLSRHFTTMASDCQTSKLPGVMGSRCSESI